jgi:carboxyl-terminal processing protease
MMFSRSIVSGLMLLLFTSYQPEVDREKEKVLGQVIQQAIMQGHFLPVQFNDEFSERAFELYLKRLDIRKQFLTQQDVDALSRFRKEIDNHIANGNYELLDIASEILKERQADAKTFYNEILDKPFDFTKKEYFEIDPEKLPFAADKNQLKEYWRLSLKYQTLTRIYTQTDIQKKAIEKNDTTVAIKTFEEIEADARKKVLKSMDDYFSRLEKLNRMDREGELFDAVATAVDPHTNYFAPKEKENFDISMSGQLEGIGATLQESDGYIKVINIVPGSPSWKQGELKVNDLILSVAQGDAEPVDIVGMRIDDAVRLIRGRKGTEVRLTLKKADNTIKTISIIRDVVIIEETYAKSAVLKKENEKQNIGYIYLPKFYADFNYKQGRKCSEDIRKELIKLRDENISGLILDLRDNGGGSLQDVVDIMGLFITTGPVVQVKSRGGQPYVLSDNDPAVYYDGKLVVMVNEISASASEILAAAVQDYKRGIVVGSASTFGKGTVQRVIDLDAYLNSSFAYMKPLGSLKLTNQKFYRINGGATQLKGVTSDIILPDNFKYIELGEKELDYPMQWTEIAAAEYVKYQKPVANVDDLRKNSEQRVNKNELFKAIDEYAKFLKEQRDRTLLPLNFEEYKTLQDNIKERNKKHEESQKEIPDLIPAPLKVDLPKIEADTTSQKRNKEWIKELKKDAYLYEVMTILKEMKDYNVSSK